MPRPLRLAIASPLNVVAALALLTGVAAASATAGSEQDDAGELPAEAQWLTTAVGSVDGAVQSTGDLDLYGFCAGDQGFSLSTVNGATSLDTQLFVFHTDGTALAFNDDSDRTWQSRVTFGPGEVPAGPYLVAVGSYYNRAENADGANVFDRDGGPNPLVTDHVFAAWSKHGRSAGSYRLDLAGTVDCAPTAPAAQAIGVDVKPGSDENPVNTRSRGRTPLALLGSAEFDATSVASESVVAGPGDATLVGDPTLADVNDDGFVDLVGHVMTADLGLASGDTELCVDATTADEQPVHGCDVVRVR